VAAPLQLPDLIHQFATQRFIDVVGQAHFSCM